MKNVFVILSLLGMLLASAHAANPRDELKQLVTQLQANPGDTALREKIIKLAKTVKPALPEEAERRMVRGAAAFKNAKNTHDFKDAVREFELASLAAPWAGDIYYNLGVAQEKAGDYAAAVTSLKLARVASPNSKDVKNLLYEVEYKRDKAQSDTAKAVAEAEQRKQRARVLDLLRGTYHAQNCQVGQDYFGGCNDDQRQGNNWHSMNWEHGPINFSFNVRDDGTVEAPKPHYLGWAECKDEDKNPVIGTPQGSQVGDIIWMYRPVNGTPRRIWTEASPDGRWIRFSCDRPVENANPAARYHYVIYYRP